jgi:hypothetical protein
LPTVLQTITAAFHWPLLVAVGLALLAVRPFPSHLLRYAARADELIGQFLDQRRLFEQSPRSRRLPEAGALEEVHAAFKALAWPDSAASYHWAVSEAMRHDIEALAEGPRRPGLAQGLRTEAARYWRRAFGCGVRFANGSREFSKRGLSQDDPDA